jgi:hypothetical protein
MLWNRIRPLVDCAVQLGDGALLPLWSTQATLVNRVLCRFLSSANTFFTNLCGNGAHNGSYREREYPLQFEETYEESNLRGFTGRLLERESRVHVLPILVIAVSWKRHIETMWLDQSIISASRCV